MTVSIDKEENKVPLIELPAKKDPEDDCADVQKVKQPDSDEDRVASRKKKRKQWN